MWRRIWQFLLPIHHDVSSYRAWWLPNHEPCVSCWLKSPASAGLGSPGESRSHSGHVGNTRRRRFITCCRSWPAAQRFWLGLHLFMTMMIFGEMPPAWIHHCSHLPFVNVIILSISPLFSTLVASLMSLMASLVTTSRMQQCFNVPIDSYHEFLLLFYCCVLLEIKLTTTTTTTLKKWGDPSLDQNLKILWKVLPT